MVNERLRLPNSERALIPIEKLRDYALNPDHRHGRHKARVFAAALGIERGDWAYLRDAILTALPDAHARAVRESRQGLVYEVHLEVDGLNGRRAELLTAWQVSHRDATPRLVTLYVNHPRGGMT